MRMLEDLKEIIDEIEKQSDWDHKFIQDMLIKQEENKREKNGRLFTDAQFKWIAKLHTKYFLQKKMPRSFK